MTDETAPAYALVQINIKNPTEFKERYAQFVLPIMERDFDGRWAANLRFPSMEAALAWYYSSPRSGSSNASTPTQRPATSPTG